MQVFWLLPIVHLGICAAQQPGAQPLVPPSAPSSAAGSASAPSQPQLQGGQVAAPPMAPAQELGAEPSDVSVAVSELAAIITPVNSPASDELCRDHVKAVHTIRVQSLLMHFNLKHTLINNLRSDIGDGFYYPFRSSLEAATTGAISKEMTDFDTKEKAFSAGLTELNGTPFYASAGTLFAALTAANTSLDSTHINHLLHIKQAWGKEEAYGSIMMLMQFDLKLYAGKLELVYRTLSDHVKLVTDPTDSDADRTSILDAYTSIRSAFSYVSNVRRDVHMLSLSFVKYLEAKKMHESAFAAAKKIVGTINTVCSGNMPTERSDANIVLGDVTIAKDTQDYVRLVPKRAIGDATTVQSWLKTAAFFRYMYALALTRMSKACHTLVAYLVTKAPSSNTEEFTNMYNALHRDISAYITAMSAYVADVSNAQLGTDHDTAAAAMVKSAETLVNQYTETVKTLVSALEDTDKAAGEGEVIRADTEIMRIAVTFLGRMVRLYKMDMIDDPMAPVPAPYANTISMLDTSTAMADGTKKFLGARVATPDAMKSAIRRLTSLNETAKDAFDTTMSSNESFRTFYPSNVDDVERHMKIFKDLQSIADAQVFFMLNPEDKENSGKKSSDFVIPTAFLAAASALMML
ncbi:tolQ-type transport protein, putative [Babesia ovata]|uniref:TolQ-type transport protein, putative n=1 Tax=Babesia ovata TaxID=189622 RepID=A0A2H6KE91_9APIC|nr:tolQ-type transport protein, putative [Babesia ovata]GBE61312.1 tolQ-type transport protein, putative [Babesia ovata]